MNRFSVLLTALLLAANGEAAAEAPGADDVSAGALVWARRLPPEAGRPRDVSTARLTSEERTDLIVLAGDRNRPMTLLALRGRDGTELWRRRLDARAAAVPARRGPGPLDAVVAASGDTLLALDGLTGKVLARTSLPGTVGELAVGDVTGDGRDEIVCTSGGAYDDALVCRRSDDLSELWRVSCPEPRGRFDDGFRMPSVLSDTGQGPRVFVRQHRTRLVALGSSGDIVWSTVLGDKSGMVPTGTAVTCPAAVDADGAGHDDLVVGTLDGTLLLLDRDSGAALASRVFGGTEHRRIAQRRRLPRALKRLLMESGEPASGYAALDLDPAPGEELVFTTADGETHAYSVRTDSLLWRMKVLGNVEYAPLPATTADGRRCLVVATTERIYYLDAATGGELDAAGPVDGCSRLLLGRFAAGAHVQAVLLDSNEGVLSVVGTSLIPVAP
ncbi:MAG: PQQ-binding-like beta-propeller repeat protein [Candidatus Eisenbacteria bacterium]|nr:PQQ-binding-like beta-propeller repeat protein [Candidatus Eisenbacteria bacterium]